MDSLTFLNSNHRKSAKILLFLVCLPPGRSLLLTPGMGMGGNQWGPIFVPPHNRIGYNGILLFRYVIYTDRYSFIFIYIMETSETSNNNCFYLVADVFDLAGDGDGGG